MIFKHNSNFDFKVTSNIEPSKKGADKFLSYIGCSLMMIAFAILVHVAFVVLIQLIK